MPARPFANPNGATGEQADGECQFVGMCSTPCDETLEFRGIILDTSDFNEFSFDDLRVSHERNRSMRASLEPDTDRSAKAVCSCLRQKPFFGQSRDFSATRE